MRKLVPVALVAALVVACNAPEGKTKADKQQFVQKMNDDVVKMFEDKKKDVADKMKKGIGYATFSNTSVTF